MPPGVEVIKYGKVIGETTAEIQTGEHVHVHNVDSKRGRGDKLN
jgi:altronate dehydratase small subunit